MNRQEYLQEYQRLDQVAWDITQKKNSDYAGEGDPFANFRLIGLLSGNPEWVRIGILTRMSDKLSRITNIVKSGKVHVKEESVEDTLLDLSIYCKLFICFLKAEKQELLKEENKNGTRTHRAAAPITAGECNP